jgi:hypothetical protein
LTIDFIVLLPDGTTYLDDSKGTGVDNDAQRVAMTCAAEQYPLWLFSAREAAHQGPRGRLEGDGAMSSSTRSKLKRRPAVQEQRLGDAGTPKRTVRYRRVLECGREVPIAPNLFVSAAIVGKKVRLLVRIASLKTNSDEQPAYEAFNGPT